MSEEIQAEGFIFPLKYTVKAMGINEKSFEALVLKIIKPHCEKIFLRSIKHKVSKNKKYLSVSIDVEVLNREQLDSLYGELTRNEKILMRL
tara:strand:- start:790 stop:1062 length:273 start_codon:yes stop_codon:yes gene_type:complete